MERHYPKRSKETVRFQDLSSLALYVRATASELLANVAKAYANLQLCSAIMSEDAYEGPKNLESPLENLKHALRSVRKLRLRLREFHTRASSQNESAGLSQKQLSWIHDLDGALTPIQEDIEYKLRDLHETHARFIIACVKGGDDTYQATWTSLMSRAFQQSAEITHRFFGFSIQEDAVMQPLPVV